MRLFNLLKKDTTNTNSNTTHIFDYTPCNVIYSIINTTHQKARFENGKVYWLSKNGEILIGFYDDEKIYNATRNIIGAMSLHLDDGNVFVQLRAIQNMKALYVNANVAGYVEEVNGEYRNIAYLQNRSSKNPIQSIMGLAASFVCLQAEAGDDQNEFSLLYSANNGK